MFPKVYISLFVLSSFRLTSSFAETPTFSSNENYVHFEDLKNERFTHMTVNKNTGQIYIGAVNKIYQLSNNLTLEAAAEMGPFDDSPECPTRVCNHTSKQRSNNWNKALSIDYSHSRLISCGSLFQGVCSFHKLDNITTSETPVSEAVVANNAHSSTVAFIALGPQKKEVLYVGVSYTGNGPYRMDVPAVSSRSLDTNKMFSIASTSVTTGTRLHVNSLSRERYPITYVYGFSSKGFSYFVTVQKKVIETAKPFHSKLTRICQNDENYYSYTEIPLVCKTAEINYNIAQAAFVGKSNSQLALSSGMAADDNLLFVVFAKSNDEANRYNEPSNNSALCIYPLSSINQKFKQNIQNCFNGKGYQGLGFVAPITSCVTTQVKIEDDFCGLDINTPLDGEMPVESAPVLTYSDTLLTSVAVIFVENSTIAFLGTSTGHLKKAVVKSVTDAFEYDEVVIDEGKAVNADMFFDPKFKNSLYVMTDKRVTMVEMHNCHVYETCSECLIAKDSTCGWCLLENKCSLRSECAEAAPDEFHWLTHQNGHQCAAIADVYPPQIPRIYSRNVKEYGCDHNYFIFYFQLTITINNLPILDGQFYCSFTVFGRIQLTYATKIASGVICPVPSKWLVPMVGIHHFAVKLGVRKNFGTDFVTTNFTFYDCNSYTTCTQCVSSQFPCDWCVGNHRCTHDTGENCRNDILVNGVSSVGPSIRTGPNFCPRITSTSKFNTEILVPSGTLKRVTVKIDSIPPFILATRFKCVFNIVGRVKSVTAQLLGDAIYCDSVRFENPSNISHVNASFAVTWEGIKPLDNPENIHCIIYNCELMASNCGICMELPEKYNCGWCKDHCAIHQNCANNHLKTVWLNKNEVCPEPKIINFWPKSGPWEIGTNVTIEGINLGRKFEDIVDGVSISQEHNGTILGHINCVPFRELYLKTSRIICNLHTQNTLIKPQDYGAISGSVTVRIANTYTAKSEKHYRFVNPFITSISPGKGPISGGTVLIISGLDMDAGYEVQVLLGTLECNVITRESNRIACITSTRRVPGEETVSVKFDNALRVFENYKFLYVEDPNITRTCKISCKAQTPVESEKSEPREPAKGIPSGGILITVKGKHLNAIQSPLIYVEVDGVKYTNYCNVTSAVEMKCKSPEVPTEKLLFINDEPIELDFGFVMDNVTSVMDLSKRLVDPFPKFLMFPNPELHKIAEPGSVIFKSDYLTLYGANLDGAASEEDVTVKIGSGLCKLTSLSRSQLTCRPQRLKTDACTDGKHDCDHQNVSVIVGDTLNFTVGRLIYEQPTEASVSVPNFTPTII